MRTPNLQYLYLQKPVTMVIIICIISILPWIGLGEFSTKGEPREAAVAISMLETGNWILPQVYADSFAYKPPMLHWLIAAFSLPQGYVSEFTARLPSALAFTVMIGFILVFFGKRLRFQQAFVATLLLITCVEMHRAAMTARVDMLLTAFMVIGLLQLYRWEDQLDLKGIPIAIPALLGCAMLTKGPVGIILPLFVFGVYLLVLRKYRFLTIFKSILYVGISSLFLPMLWYIAAWKNGGDNFINVVLAENFGRFFHLSTPEISYVLGHENGAWYNLVTLIAGFLPWTLLFFFSLFGLKYTKPEQPLSVTLKNWWDNLIHLEKEKLFSLIALVCIIFFYSIPSSKRSVYLMPAYPFIAIFLAQYALYITEYKTRVIRFFAGFMLFISIVAFTLITLVMTGLLQLQSINNAALQKALATVGDIQAMIPMDAINRIVLILFLAAIVTLFYQMFKKINIKILYASIFLAFTINLVVDGIVMRGHRHAVTARYFANKLQQAYNLNKDNMFVTNNLLEYRNLYGLNFYLGNQFRNFEKELPASGYFFCAGKSWEKIQNKYGDAYQFTELTSTPDKIGDVNDIIIVSQFQKNSTASAN